MERPANLFRALEAEWDLLAATDDARERLRLWADQHAELRAFSGLLELLPAE